MTRDKRDLRLDFFRGLALAIIFINHVPFNWLAQYTPSQFGFSDAAEIFVFISGTAAAMAYGGTFQRAGWPMGTARIVLRCWQIYVAHLGLFFGLAAICALAWAWFDQPDYIGRLNLWYFFHFPTEAMVGLFGLSYVPNYFDILPMYVVTLALVPLVMALARVRPGLVLVFCLGLYAAVWLFGLNLPAEPRSDRPWFFNPFAWQLIFFTGYALASGWLRPPPLSAWRVLVCCVFLVFCALISHYPLYSRIGWLSQSHEWLAPWARKTDLGPLRLIHFLALAYVSVVLLQVRDWRCDSALARPLVRMGQQALPVFVLGMMLSYVGGMVLDQLGRTAPVIALVNLGGLAILAGAALLFAWYKRQPWRQTLRSADHLGQQTLDLVHSRRQVASDLVHADQAVGLARRPVDHHRAGGVAKV